MKEKGDCLLTPLSPSLPPDSLTDLYERLANAAPGERFRLLLTLLERAPLALSVREEQGAVLDEIDLSPAAWDDSVPASWRISGRADLQQADLRGASLRRANLEDADLRQARLDGAELGSSHLRGALLEEASLSDADLAGADLQGAQLGGAKLNGAMLEEARLQGAILRFAELKRAVLEGAAMQRADLWGADLTAAELPGAQLQDAMLQEGRLPGANLAGADLRCAVLTSADLSGANLRGADLRGASLKGANLSEANLQDAKLEGLVLTETQITHVCLGGAWLDRTRLNWHQLGGAIGEHRAGQCEAARQGYLALERNFEDLGDSDAASWSYRRKRRMQKCAARQRGREALRERRWREALVGYGLFAADQFVEWLCDYGESIPRVIVSMLVVYLLFVALFGMTGSVARTTQTAAGLHHATTRHPLDLALFGLMVVGNSGNTDASLTAQGVAGSLLITLEGFLMTALTGLLGFVAGQRIRR